MESAKDHAEAEVILPGWTIRLGRRVACLPNGRYNLLLTVDGQRADWTIVYLGKVEATVREQSAAVTALQTETQPGPP
ncbi:MAG: hypothetical protein GXY76_16965 [Chloroflexi bacterium]|nr:hypothetical protein [Chloroflexota bacterium]